MTLVYPLNMPASPKPLDASIYIERNQTTVETFARKKQIHRNPGDRWIGKISLPPMSASDAADWLGFFDALDGFVGTFSMPHPDYHMPRGSALGSGLVDGGGQRGTTLQTRGWGVSQSVLFKRGDMLEVGGRLKRIVVDAASGADGSAELTIMPALIESPADTSPVIVTNPTGIFSLSDGFVAPTSDHLGHHRFSFAVEEAL
ncbi:hypothetical protein GCM10017044_10940 [Kordiimonas sediminis]|uniref:Uncharacterized protein n=1 Tax=Kordiimonas sediminis TaxID=1735581 RepID=A0A919AQD0_9PROT|nr:hypothetical protein [Kordiimonas sediminis]GHF18239.1 hypothetical protein GCM10017044_10940 [Kordiimonas sediminis]